MSCVMNGNSPASSLLETSPATTVPQASSLLAAHTSELDLCLSIPATLLASEELVTLFRAHCRARLPREAAFASELLLREVLHNALQHGCASNPERVISCRLRMDSRRLLLRVSDGGSGFDWRAACQRRAIAEAPSGRGLWILASYASHIRFSRRGNTVTVLKRFEGGQA